MKFEKGQTVHVPCQNKDCNHKIKTSFDDIQNNKVLKITCPICNTSFDFDTEDIMKQLQEQAVKELKKYFKMG